MNLPVIVTLVLGGAGLLLLFLLAVPLLAFRRPRRHRPGDRYDAIVVLGCRVQDDGRPGHLLRSRVEKAVELFRAGAAPRLVLTGGAVYTPFREADVMARLAMELGVPPDAIVREPEARNTRENARLTATLMRHHGWRTALLVTSSFHVRRASLLFREAGIPHHAAGAPEPDLVPLKTRLMLPVWEQYLLVRIAMRRGWRGGGFRRR